MGIRVKAAALVTGRYWKRWRALTQKPQQIQNQLLLDIVKRNRGTRFGSDHRFDLIQSLHDYRQQVAIGDYESLRPYVEHAVRGETNVLTAEPVLLFTMTSGSTGEPKLIPVTKTGKRHHHELTRLWYYLAYREHPDLFSGALLGLVSPAIEGRTAGGTPYGAASGLIYESSPSWIQNAYVVPYVASQIKDFEAKYYVVMRFALEKEISFFGTPNPSTILKLLETADRHKDDIIKDVRDGSISLRCNMSPEIRDQLARRLGKNPARARELEKLANGHGTLRPADYWSRLQLIGCWKGGTVGTRLKEFSRWFADATPVRDLGYMASEAQMTLPISNAGSDGILAIDKNFYEFIPESEIGSRSPTILTCGELEEGQFYYVILTTPGGLYRYDINDVVRVVGFFNQTPLIEFVRKGRDVANITGEKLHVNQVIEALSQAQSAAGSRVQHFRVFADVDESLYTFSLEFAGAIPSRQDLAHLLYELDGRLQDLNVEYAQKRASQRLGAPILCVMKSGWYERSIEASRRRGARDVQFKARLLSSTPEDPSEILLIVDDVAQSRNSVHRSKEAVQRD